MPTKKIYTNTLAQIGGKIMTALISIFLIKIISNYLDLAGYGLYSKIYNYLSIFAVMADLGLYTISVREMSHLQDNPKKLEEISGNILSLRTVSGVLIIILSLVCAFFLEWYNSPTALLGIFIVSIFTLFGLINSSIMSYLQATLRTEFSFISNTAGKLLTFLWVLATVYIFAPNHATSSENQLLFIFLAWLAGNIFMTILTWWYASKFQKIKFYWDKNYIIHILKLSIPYGVALFLGVIFFKVDTLFLSLLENPTNADTITGLYSVPMKIVEVGMMYGTIFLNSFLPVLTVAIEQKDTQKTKQLTKKWFELLMGFGVGISVFLAFFATKIIQFIADDKFLHTTFTIAGYEANSATVLQIVSWIFLFYFISSLANYILIAKNQQKKIIFVNLFIALFNIIGNLIIIPFYSFIGASIITVISQILLVFISIYLVRDTFEIRKIIAKWSLLLGASLFSGYIALITSHFLVHTSNFIFLAITGSIFGFFYVGLWYLFHRIIK